MLRRVWRWIERAVCLAAVLLTLVVAVVVVQIYRILAGFHGWLGVAFGALVAGTLLVAACWFLITQLRHPTVLQAPPRVSGRSTRGEHRHYARYLVRFMSRLRAHPLVSAEQRDIVGAYRVTLRRAVASSRSAQVADTVAQCETQAIEPVMRALDARAQALVEATVRDVMQGVTLSPWNVLDLPAVTFRNLAMVARVVAVYDNRPLVREYLVILRDVVSVVSTVNVLSFGNQLLRNLMSDVPAMGHFAEDVARGVGAGLLTSVAGQAAMARCRGYRGWSREEARRHVAEEMSDTLHGLMDQVAEVVMPQLRSPLESRMSGETSSTKAFDRVKNGVVHAVEETCDVVHVFMRTGHGTDGDSAADEL